MTIFMARGQGLWHHMQVYQLFVMQEKRFLLLVEYGNNSTLLILSNPAFHFLNYLLMIIP